MNRWKVLATCYSPAGRDDSGNAKVARQHGLGGLEWGTSDAVVRCLGGSDPHMPRAVRNSPEFHAQTVRQLLDLSRPTSEVAEEDQSLVDETPADVDAASELLSEPTTVSPDSASVNQANAHLAGLVIRWHQPGLHGLGSQGERP